MALQLPRGRLKPQKTIPVVLEGVHIPADNPKPVTLHIRYAGRANEGYFNAQVETPAAKSNGGPAALSKAQDLRLAKIFADHVIDHWTDVLDTDSAPVAYTAELGLELFTWLIDEEQRPDRFKLVEYYAINAHHFTTAASDPVDVGKR